MANDEPISTEGMIAMHLVGEVDMAGWEPPRYESRGTFRSIVGPDIPVHLYACSTCAALVGVSAAGFFDGQAGHTEYHRNLAEMYARLANAITQLGGLPFVTVTAQPVCTRCNGTRLIVTSDPGLMGAEALQSGAHGAEVPCPDCT